MDEALERRKDGHPFISDGARTEVYYSYSKRAPSEEYVAVKRRHVTLRTYATLTSADSVNKIRNSELIPELHKQTSQQLPISEF